MDAQHFLVLLTRHRDSLIAAERLHRRYRYDFRRFSSTLAAYGHIRRLATAAPASAHVATSMRQLVEGFAAFHPEWELDRGDSFVNRDRYHSTVRDHLADLVACGLLTWQAGVNDEGEERRTELLLLDAPQVDVEELALAKTRLTWWARRYPGLDTGSSVRVPNAPRAAKALPPGQRAKRARARCKAAKAAKAAGGPAGARGFSSSGAPPSGALPALQGKASNPPSALNVPSATPTRTPELGSRTHRGANGLGVEAGARASAREFPSVPQGAVETKWNCIAEEEVDQSSGDLGHAGGALSAAGGVRSGAELSAEAERRVAAVLADPEQMARLATEQRSVDELHAAIGRQASRRTLELAASPAERAWPPIRVREAWALARYGPDQIGPGSATAVRLSHDRHAQLLRAVRRYERYIGLALAVAPGSSAERGRLEHLHGLPAGGWAAFLHLAGRGIHHSPAGSVQALDVLSRQLRAIATAHDPGRRDAMARRATDRHQPAEDWKWWKTNAPAWPAWMRLDADGRPIFEHGEDSSRGIAVEADHPQLPPAGDPHRRLIERDAWLVLGHWPPAELDGRQLRHQRDHGRAPLAQRPAAFDPAQAEILELARLEPGLTPQQAAQLSAELREDMLRTARRRRLTQHQAEREALQQQLAQNPSQPNREIPPGWSRAK